eukprot:CAMPEP_0201594664 /NCGR_PEP_ID=MMETSP0190_2-20130828/191913_1 /ASSEMBLY_ACC=CAM_ASM_000263 /TAXON_ID=37353 /ORGANISM="Rosalina sp." /LENGTH=215 /DNA_ID=CAMNT_0048054367 /DNA_START=31 /DNA_END=678 /DNA_ORIENTATION=-
MFLITEMLLTTKHPYPDYDESNEETKKLQMIEAKKHTKFNTMEQARLDAISRVMQSEQKGSEKAKAKMVSSIKMDREPEFDTNEDIKKLQESHYTKHRKIDTMEQARLDAVARLAATENRFAGGAKKVQKSGILSDDQYHDNNKIEKRIRKEIKKEYDNKIEIMRDSYNESLEKTKAELNALQEIVRELEESKLKLVISTSAEIDKLRDALKINS